MLVTMLERVTLFRVKANGTTEGDTVSGYRVCDTCAAAIVNDDFSGMGAETEATVTAFVERVGYIVHVGEYENGGYWDCDACGETTIGDGHTFEPLS